MILVTAFVGPFRSINSQQEIEIDEKVTVLVGMNEAGKTVFLKALEKARDALGAEDFEPTEDYPRKDLTAYLKRHASTPDLAVKLVYQLTNAEVDDINQQLGIRIPHGWKFAIDHKYDNGKMIDLTIDSQIDQAPAVAALAKFPGLSDPAASAVKTAKTVSAATAKLAAVETRNEADESLLQQLNTRAAKLAKTNWTDVLSLEVWRLLSKKVPSFLYFSDYDLLPGKLNLKDLANRTAAAKADAAQKHQVKPQHKAVLALLRMADVEVSEFSGNTSYEVLKSKVEAVSISLTDQVLEFWKQNEDLEVEVDIRSDPTDEPPFNDGPNLYLRIKNRRHRGVTTPFDQRSRGFIWFFSFLVWFDSVQHQLNAAGEPESAPLILLLDEPGLALHALAQADFLRYIDSLSNQHQVIYTTHSPFMVHSDRLEQVRVVEDRATVGTVISKNMAGYDDRTIFPLQAALGWTLAQNLFIGKYNLLVEGPSELAYLKAMSAFVEASGGKGLSDKITIVPADGLTNVATFILLLGANGLQFAVLHDYSGGPEQKLESLIRNKLLEKKAVFNASQFREAENPGQDTVPSDIEDLFSPSIYLGCFNKAYAKELSSPLLESELESGSRIVQRIERALQKRGEKVRPSGGFNHYLVASTFAASPPALDDQTLKRFANLFKAISSVLK
ncbi:AAA family ATPase [Lysobacter sp. 22409]|uniref:AAA family ATPase n=1 Tax=Lysobacter sp. 22409 TaxID=3453917 RepID=UPI003F8713AA